MWWLSGESLDLGAFATPCSSSETHIRAPHFSASAASPVPLLLLLLSSIHPHAFSLSHPHMHKALRPSPIVPLLPLFIPDILSALIVHQAQLFAEVPKLPPSALYLTLYHRLPSLLTHSVSPSSLHLRPP
jgi:hypothetical protein